jgi:hypothetical protein
MQVQVFLAFGFALQQLDPVAIGKDGQDLALDMASVFCGSAQDNVAHFNLWGRGGCC